MITTSEKMFKLHSQWKQSGMSRMAFCKQENINYSSFHYWHKQFSSEPEQRFTEIAIEQEPAFSSDLIFSSGVRMVFHSAPCVSWLKALVN